MGVYVVVRKKNGKVVKTNKFFFNGYADIPANDKGKFFKKNENCSNEIKELVDNITAENNQNMRRT